MLVYIVSVSGFCMALCSYICNAYMLAKRCLQNRITKLKGIRYPNVEWSKSHRLVTINYYTDPKTFDNPIFTEL